MSDQLRRLLRDLANEAPETLDAHSIKRTVLRRRSWTVGVAAASVAACGLAAATLIASPSSDTLEQQAVPATAGTAGPSPAAEPSPSATPSGAAQPSPAALPMSRTPTADPTSSSPPAAAPTSTSATRSGREVAWRPRPVDSAAPDPARRPAPAGTRRCTAADLQFHVSADFRAPGDASRRTVIIGGKHVGDSDCGLDDHGFTITFPDTDAKTSSASTGDARPDTLVRSGERIVLLGLILNWCEPERGPLRIALGDAQNVQHAVAGTVSPPSCAADRYGTKQAQAGAGFYTVAAAGSPLLLAPRLTAPLSADSGSQLRYDVELINTSDQAIAFADCPGFTHAVGYLGQSNSKRSTQTHLAPCSDMPASVPAGQSVTLTDVVASVPAISGKLTLGWSWGSPDPAAFGESWDGVRGVPVNVR